MVKITVILMMMVLVMMIVGHGTCLFVAAVIFLFRHLVISGRRRVSNGLVKCCFVKSLNVNDDDDDDDGSSSDW